MKYLALIFLIFLLTGCKKDQIKPEDLLPALSFSKSELLADGTQQMYVTAEVNIDADETRRTVVFTASSGGFGSKSDSTINQKPIFENGKLIARVQYRAPSTPGVITIRARIDLADEKRDLSVSRTINAVLSKAEKISLTASSFSVLVNFLGEINITGVLTNNDRTPASKGNKVLFNDSDDNGVVVNGLFRQIQNSSDGSGGVSVNYSPGYIPAGKRIWIKCTLLDDKGQKTTIKDSLQIQTISN